MAGRTALANAGRPERQVQRNAATSAASRTATRAGDGRKALDRDSIGVLREARGEQKMEPTPGIEPGTY